MKLIIRLFSYAKPWAAYLAVSVFSLMAVTAINLWAPSVTKQVIAALENDFTREGMKTVVAAALLLLALYALRSLFQFFNSYFSHVASWRLVAAMRERVYDHFQRLSLRYYSDKQTGQLMSRVVNDTATFETLIAHALGDLLTNVITFVGVTVILFSIDARLAALTFIPIPFLAVFSVLIRRMRRSFREGQKKISELNALLQDDFSGIKEIQAFNQQEKSRRQVRECADAHASAVLKALFYSAVLHPSVNFVSSCGTVIVLIFGPLFVLKYGINMSDLVAFLLYLSLFYAPVAALGRLLEEIQQALAGAERVFEVLDTQADIADLPDAVTPGKLRGNVCFDRVGFAYREGETVLRDVSFEVREGKMLALVGPTGAGKTTVALLLARFYDPLTGRISIDGTDIKAMTLSGLRDQLSLVLQDVFLFNGTVAENIAYGCGTASAAQIRAAARTACVDEFIDSLPEGYDTYVGERGMRLSGGQKQRIAIARAVLRDTPVLILDEATSAVDTETESEIQRAIQQISGTRTMIVIAHRLSTVRHADQIVVINGQGVEETGTHEELMRRGGLYAHLCSVQTEDGYLRGES